ncbi:cobalamin binding intrinsic factor-like [Cetorhinus maximus]
MSRLKLFIVLLPMVTGRPSEQCGTPVQESRLVASLLRTLLRSAEDAAPEPSVLIALRLSQQHDLSREEQILRQLKQNVIENGTEFSSGTAAWYTMALLASCEDPVNVVVQGRRQNLVALLMDTLQKDLNSAGSGRLTDYHQISLAVLALCKSSICLPAKTIEDIFMSAVQHSIQGEITYPVDTMSISALALRCMSFVNCDHRTPTIESALQNVTTGILANVHSDGTIGDLSTTGLAVQALTANHDLVPPGSWDCRKSVGKLVQGISNGTFHNPLAASLVIPTLEDRTFLDIDTLDCSSQAG